MAEQQAEVPASKRKKLAVICQALTVLFSLPGATLCFIQGNVIAGALMSIAGTLMLVGLVGRVLCPNQ